MADKQKTQEKKAWSTPMVIVLTRTVDETEVVLRGLCKLSSQDGWKRSNQNEAYELCKKQQYVCTNFCANMTTV